MEIKITQIKGQEIDLTISLVRKFRTLVSTPKDWERICLCVAQSPYGETFGIIYHSKTTDKIYLVLRIGFLGETYSEVTETDGENCYFIGVNNKKIICTT